MHVSVTLMFRALFIGKCSMFRSYDMFYSIWRPVLSQLFNMTYLDVVVTMWQQVRFRLGLL